MLQYSRMKNVYIFGGALLALIVLMGGWSYYQSTLPGKYDTFAQCLTEKGAIFYGAFWCPHCQNQKKMFGNSMEYIRYVECSTADGQGQLPVCTEKGVKSYPTWLFADGSMEPGELTLERLSEKTGCMIPAES